MTGILRDVRFGTRQLQKSMGFTIVAVITMALGIGSNTAIFSNVNALLLHPFGLAELDRVVAVWETVPKEDATSVKVAPANFRDWKQQSKSFEQLAAVQGWNANLTGEGIAERVEGYRVTSQFFPLLAVSPYLGRNLGDVDFQRGPAPVVVISQGFWRKNLGSDPTIVGRDLLLNGQKFTVVGVASEGADFPAGAELWTPLDPTTSDSTDRSNHFLVVIGRVSKNSSIPNAGADLQAIATRLSQQFPATNGGHGVRAVSLVEDVTQGTRQFVSVLMGAAVFVLLLACVNVANLQLARATSRQKEMAVRLGLGAGRWQLIRQLLVESILLSAAGAIVGVALASFGMSALRADLPPFIVQHVPGLKHIDFDMRVLGFTIAVALVSGVLSGLAPALQFSRSQVGETLKENARGSSASGAAGKLRALLVTSEIALALVLLVGAGLMVKGFRHIFAIEPGFDRSRVLTFSIALPDVKYQTDDQVRAYFDRTIRDLQSIPSVQSVACVSSLPSSWYWNWTEYKAEGAPPAAPGETPSTISQIITPDFFATLRIPLLKGRTFSAEDARDSLPVAVISESMARRNWPGQDPIGKHVKLGPRDSHQPDRLVVGIVADIRPNVLDTRLNPTTYVPLTQLPSQSSSFVLRTTTEPSDAAASVVAQVRNIDPSVPAYDVRTLKQGISDNMSGVESSARMMMVFAAVALILAAAGIFAVMAYAVSKRTHEIGVRMALGAQRNDVLRLVISSALKMAVLGLAIGLFTAGLLARALSSVLFGVVQVDLSIFGLLTAVLAAVALLAAYVPARWATKVDPVQALRYE
ncbi:MAG TPA: ABC transporter permease [Candidatus Binatia bacterium]|nr:ABC transporter permease [Candidatus Binatia bacterium]